MKIRILPLVVLLSFIAILSSCQNEKAAQEKLQKEVLDAHDVIMARMDELNEDQLQLDQLRNNFKNLNNADTATLGLSIDSAKSDLSKADEAMMEWMHNFDPDYTGMSHQQIMDYLGKQRKSIDSVKVLFDQSLSRSKAIIQKHK
ncbi:hypothetical protein Pedsa_1450 [Pseudopedobacter saltans DSM 12145]|uniref:Viral A-type inclusion protein n=1 Tax=Pseudopedobacter saltans (strain ATCC 51119 / DSM 12145 / JCM 21818 / CCUG 39354 / LMG 10337 / NBRC 100064 / NCIMB 13643) TaxID=762903 RepID=F0S4M1_PSESL|nr:hypothetical protein [Pseudopedobacter saltans]ADY52012.1 hypothetical protein Pedsa_1450 [Pseudopedobacter saltans DSM 12145]